MCSIASNWHFLKQQELYFETWRLKDILPLCSAARKAPHYAESPQSCIAHMLWRGYLNIHTLVMITKRSKLQVPSSIVASWGRMHPVEACIWTLTGPTPSIALLSHSSYKVWLVSCSAATWTFSYSCCSAQYHDFCFAPPWKEIYANPIWPIIFAQNIAIRNLSPSMPHFAAEIRSLKPSTSDKEETCVWTNCLADWL